MTSPKGKKALNIELPIELHNALKKTAIDHGITVTAVIIQYIQFLQQKPVRQRKILNEQSETSFKLDGAATRKLHGTNKLK